MSEFSFYLGPTERLKLTEYVLAQDGYYLVPNAPFDGSVVPRIFGKLTEAGLEERIPNGSAFIFGPFSEHGPCVRPLPGGGNRVSGNQGGPLFYLRMPKCIVAPNGSFELRPGALGVEAAFWDSETKVSVPPSLLAKQHYQRLLKAIKTQVTSMQRHAGYWMGDEAWSLWEDNRAVFTPRGVTETLRQSKK